jgi:hypothetical protein
VVVALVEGPRRDVYALDNIERDEPIYATLTSSKPPDGTEYPTGFSAHLTWTKVVALVDFVEGTQWHNKWCSLFACFAIVTWASVVR